MPGHADAHRTSAAPLRALEQTGTDTKFRRPWVAFLPLILVPVLLSGCDGDTSSSSLEGGNGRKRFLGQQPSPSPGPGPSPAPLTRSKQRDARFLMYATFGPTRRSLAALGDETSYLAWIRAQMALPVGSHRAYYRSRANSRLTGASQPGTPRSLCEAGSRWHRFAFTLADVGKAISVRDKEVRVEGVFRTYLDPTYTGNGVPAPGNCTNTPPQEWIKRGRACEAAKLQGRCRYSGSSWVDGKFCQKSCYDQGVAYDDDDDCSIGWASLKFDGYICSLEEAVGGWVGLSADSACASLSLFGMENPAIWFTPAASSQSTETALPFDALKPGVLLLSQSSASCQLSSFIRVAGEYYLHDPRLKLVQNTLESPATSSAEACPTVARTFLNEKSCRLQPVGTTEYYEACGSPGESANDPGLGHASSFYTLFEGKAKFSDLDFDDVWLKKPDPALTKSAVWTMRALEAEDQLRQRMAWALSQIFVVGTEGFGNERHSELWVNYYDIFVRNAFGNFRDVLREVTYSALMGGYLTFLRNTAHDHDGHYPDENYAREIMQLFTIGLWKLHPNGSRVLNEKGADVPTYGNEHIMNFARVLTGFDEQLSRANIEKMRGSRNKIDPMRMRASLHDVYPKPDLDGNYLGDGYPLCSDLPARSFLAKGANYTFLGYTYDGSDVLITSQDSALFAALCSGGATCTFALNVALSADLQCHEDECTVDTPTVVKVKSGYYEYVPPTCVHFFFSNGRATAEGGGSQKCADPNTLAAGTSCCGGCTNRPTRWMTRKGKTCENANVTWPKMYTQYCHKSSSWARRKFCQLSCWQGGVGYDGDKCSQGAYREKRTCGYQGERVRLAIAEARCASLGLAVCPTRTAAEGCGYDDAPVWLPTNCSISIAVDADGHVSAQTDDKAKQNKFAVQWLSGFPTAGACPSECTASGDACLCSASVDVRPVFDRIPSKLELQARLKIGSLPPAGSCTTCGGEVRAYAASGAIDESTVFEADGRFFKNAESLVHAGGFAFRNPPVFALSNFPNERAALAEVESLLDHLFRHPNTPVFIGYRLIQRFVTSNPSPTYIHDVGEAFRTGRYGDAVFSGAYGDLAATVAAILLHPEAHDPKSPETHGALREPLVKIIHFLRAMEYQDAAQRDVIMKDLQAVIGQAPFQSPSVFNFYTPDYQPARFPVGVVGPEFQIFTAPWAVGFLNGMMSLIDHGLSSCDKGFGLQARPCAQGNFSLGELGTANETASETLAELDLLLTGGRLSAKDVIQTAYDTAAETDRLKAAQRAIVMTPEFHTLGDPLRADVRAAKASTAASTAASTPTSYKATVMLFLAGGADTFNMLVPFKCSLYDEYMTVREGIALKPSQLQEIATSGQSCEKFGIHFKLPFLKELYDQKQAAFVSNIGSLVEPTTKEQFKKGGASRCVGLFSHSDQQQAAQTLQCQIPGASPKGAGGRVADALASKQFSTTSFSVAGTSTWSQGFDTHIEIIDRSQGAVRFQRYEQMQTVIGNLTSYRHNNVYCEEYAQQLAEAIESNENLGSYLDNVSLKTDYAADTGLAKQLRQVARLIATRDDRKAERDFFFVQLGGFDTHSNVNERLYEKFEEMDNALRGFVTELKAQGVFDSTVLATESDFGRTLTSNGAGTDHAWAGNHFVLGGSVNGGKVLNDFPASLLKGNEQDVGRGRLIPKYPWESMMVPIAEWMGVDPADHAKVFPNLARFNRSSQIIDRSNLFTS